eukprot:GILI01004968.1.p1 GENE.GILI01004968.1~~GILI01004968.1.p1  ORF type:complete len:425 (+),score=163.19 GILI01004968.1:46-1320(+)
MSRSLLLVCAALLAVAVVAQHGTRTLVIMDDNSVQNSHSTFFKDLESRGHKLTYKVAGDSSLKLKEYGEYLFDNIVLFAPSAEELGGFVSVKNLLEFIDDGHHILVAGGSDISENIRELANECGVDFDDQGTSVWDPSSPEADKSLVRVSAASATDAAVIVSKPKQPVLFQGVGQMVSPNNKLLLSILWGTPSSLSADSVSSAEPVSKGADTLLVTALQARNNARVTFSGSLEMFSNKFFQHKIGSEVAGNRKFCAELSQWTFGERGVLQASNISHRKAGESGPSDTYRIKDDVEYSVELREWNGREWVAYDDEFVQLEFVMLDPHVRLNLKHAKGSPVYHTAFKVPDVYGVFQFKIDYSRPGYSFLRLSTQVAVRPYLHNEYERFIFSAYPYYIAAYSMLIGSFCFGLVFLYGRTEQSKAKTN